MGEVYTYDATHLTLVDAEELIEFTQRAEHGDVGGGTFQIDDSAGTLALVGQKDFSVTQSLASNTLIFRGFVGSRVIEPNDAPRVSAARTITVNVEDLNSMLGHLLIDGTDGNRPSETVAERGAWLMASDYVAFAQNLRCDFPADKGMDAADYRYQHAGDVLADMALAAGGYNYHVNDWGYGPELTFRDDNASTADTSTLRISNVLSDASSVTLNPKTTGTLTRSPAKVISKQAYSYAKGTVVEERAATATAFNGERSGSASNSNIKTAAKASDESQAQLWQLHTEEDIIECEIDAVPAAQINLILPGMRLQAKFSHLNTEGYGSFTYFRVLERTVSPLNAEGALYSLGLKLSPQEAAETFPSAYIVQSLFAFYGTGGSGLSPYTHLTNPPTIGNVLLVALSVRGTATTPAPPNSTESPALPSWGAGAWTNIAAEGNTRVLRAGSDYMSMAFFWKTVDSTDQDCVILNDYENVGVWEIAGADMASATYVRANEQAAASTYDIGTLGTVAVGELAFMMNHSVPDDLLALPELTAADWTKDHYRGSYPIWYATTYPVVWMGHAVGAGATVDPSAYRGSARAWCGIAIKVPAL